MEAVDGLRRDRARRDRRSRRRRWFGSTGIDPNRIGLQRRAGVDLDLGVDPTLEPTDPTSAVAPATTQSTPEPSTTPVEPTTLEPPSTVPTLTDAAPVDPGQLPAIDVLATIPIEREQGAGYNRELFGYGSPIDGFGCRTRALVLIRDSLTPPQIDRVGCAVVAGDWFSTYDGLTSSDPGEIEIDHVVALKEAWDSGANAWSAERLEAFSNDLVDARTLRAVTGAVEPGQERQRPDELAPARTRRGLRVPRRLGVDQGALGPVDGRVRAWPHPQSPHRSMSGTDDRAMGRRAACGTDGSGRCAACDSPRSADRSVGRRQLRSVVSRRVHPSEPSRSRLRRHHVPALRSPSSRPAPFRRRRQRRRMRVMTFRSVVTSRLYEYLYDL